MKFTCEMLPAEHGDCLWIEYGRGRTPHRVVIDGGPDGSTVLLDRIKKEIGKSRRRFRIELLVITHVDDDHIGGVLSLLENLPANVQFGDIWFNAFKHLLPKDRMGGAQGERLSGILNGDKNLPWNMAWGKHKGEGAVVLPSGTEPLPCKRLTGRLKLTLLSPTAEKLKKLIPDWEKSCQRAKLLPGGEGLKQKDRLGRKDRWPPDVRVLARSKPGRDTSANGSSIAFLAEYGGKSLLLSGDAHHGTLKSSIKRVCIERGLKSLSVNAFKVPHHGSSNNISNELLNLLDCNQYLISTSGKQFSHPDFAALSRIIMNGGKNPELVFNYKSKTTQNWGAKKLRNTPYFDTRYPGVGSNSVLLSYL